MGSCKYYNFCAILMSPKFPVFQNRTKSRKPLNCTFWRSYQDTGPSSQNLAGSVKYRTSNHLSYIAYLLRISGCLRYIITEKQ